MSSPVYIDDTITVTAEITAVADHPRSPGRLGRVDELVTAVNQHGDVVLSLVHLYLVEKRGGPPEARAIKRRTH